MTIPGQDKPALKWGVPLGVALGVLAILHTLLAINGHDIELGGWFGFVQFAIVSLSFLGVGWWVTRETASVTQGAFGGLTVGVVAAFLAGFTDLLLALFAPVAYAHLAGFDKLSTQQVALAGTAVAAFLQNLLTYGIFGAALGAVGGLVTTIPGLSRPRSDPARSR